MVAAPRANAKAAAPTAKPAAATKSKGGADLVSSLVVTETKSTNAKSGRNNAGGVLPSLQLGRVVVSGGGARARVRVPLTGVNNLASPRAPNSGGFLSARGPPPPLESPRTRAEQGNLTARSASGATPRRRVHSTQASPRRGENDYLVAARARARGYRRHDKADRDTRQLLLALREVVRRHGSHTGRATKLSKASVADAPDAARAVGRPVTRSAAPLAEAFAALPANPYERVALFNALKECGVVSEEACATVDDESRDLLIGGADFIFDGASGDVLELEKQLASAAHMMSEEGRFVAGSAPTPGVGSAWTPRSGRSSRRVDVGLAQFPPLVEPLIGDPAFADDAERFVRFRDGGVLNDDAISKAELRKKQRGAYARVRRIRREEQEQLRKEEKLVRRHEGHERQAEMMRLYNASLKEQQTRAEKHRDPMPGSNMVEVLGPRLRGIGRNRPHDLLVPNQDGKFMPTPPPASGVAPLRIEMKVPQGPAQEVRYGASIALLCNAGKDFLPSDVPKKSKMSVPPPDRKADAPPPPEGRGKGDCRPADDGMDAAARGGALPQTVGEEPVISHGLVRSSVDGGGAAFHKANDKRGEGGMHERVAKESEEAPTFFGGAKPEDSPKSRVRALQLSVDDAPVAEFDAKRVSDFKSAAAPEAHRQVRSMKAAGDAPRKRHPGLPARRPGWAGKVASDVGVALVGPPLTGSPSPTRVPRTSLVF